MKQLKDDVIALIGGIALGISIGIRLCEWSEKRKQKKWREKRIKMTAKDVKTIQL